MQLDEDLPVVVSAAEMDDETFKLHFNHRHADELPGLTEMLPNIQPDTLHMYRLFHDALHRWLRMETPHEHEW
jgi:hypothetical protein